MNQKKNNIYNFFKFFNLNKSGGNSVIEVAAISL